MNQSGGKVSRRTLVIGGGLAIAAAGLGADMGWLLVHKSTPGSYRAFTDHEAAVIEAATARLVPGPHDDPAETGHPGAREANVVGYIDTMLGALHHQPEKVYAGGPFSDRAGASHDDMADFLPLPTAVRAHWATRLRRLRRQYADGVRQYDRQARAAGAADFTRLGGAGQDQILAADLKAHPHGFTDTLFAHTVEGMYAVPEYGGNANLVGWKDIDFRGDTQPSGWPPERISHGEGPDPYRPTAVVEKILGVYTATAPPPLSRAGS